MLPPNSPIFPSDVLDITSQLPEKPLAQTASVQLFLLLTEPNLFVQGFEPHEYAERPPSILRGALYLRILKPVKIKSISLSFKGQQRTDWPEGIPPKKTAHAEVEDLISHTWPFYNSSMQSVNGNADIFKNLPDTTEDITHFSLDSTAHFFTRSLSPANAFRRAASPSISSINSINLTVQNSNSDLTSVLSADSDSKPGLFNPGDYIYNFEHPIPASTPESCSVTFGSVHYHLEANISRMGAFKSNINTKLPVKVIRTPSDTSIEESEPIAISRDWEDQLHYDIVIASKSIILDTYLPIAFKLTPLAKVQIHRIRIYLTENLEYYCRNKKVHRMEPVKKFLLLEQKAESGKSILTDPGHEDEISAKELEFQLFVPERLNERQKIHPDTSFTNIQCHHWIKLCLRLSRIDPTNPEKRKHYEISIDSPIHVLSPLSVHANTLLPAYDNSSNTQPQACSSNHNYLQVPPLSPGVIPVDNSLDAMVDQFTHLDSSVDPSQIDMHLDANLYKPKDIPNELRSPQAVPFSPVTSPQLLPLSPMLATSRPMHLIRRPSTNPPPFDADMSPPPFNYEPPAYESIDSGMLPTAEEEDVGERFSFRGLSPDLPSSVIRHSSPSPLPTRFRRSMDTEQQHSIDDELERDVPLSLSDHISNETNDDSSSNDYPDIDSFLRLPDSSSNHHYNSEHINSYRNTSTASNIPSTLIIPPTPTIELSQEDLANSNREVQDSRHSLDSLNTGDQLEFETSHAIVPVNSAETVTHDNVLHERPDSDVAESPGIEGNVFNPIGSLDDIQPPHFPDVHFRSRNSSESSLRSENSLISNTSFEPMEPLLHSVSTVSYSRASNASSNFNDSALPTDYRDRNESVDITAMLTTNRVTEDEIWHAISDTTSNTNKYYSQRPPLHINLRKSSFTQQNRSKDYPIFPTNGRHNSFGVVNSERRSSLLPILSVIDMNHKNESTETNAGDSSSSRSSVDNPSDGSSTDNPNGISEVPTQVKSDNQFQLESNYVIE